MTALRTATLAFLAVASGCGGKSEPAALPKAEAGEGEAAPFVETARDAIVGRRAPAVTLELLDGSHVELAKYLGHQPIYLKFWATWCVPCREQMPHLEETFRAHGDQLAVFAIDVNLDDPIDNVRQMVATKHLAVPVAFDADGSIAEQFHLNVTPQHVLIDRAGVVRYVGHAVTPELEHAITAVLGAAAGDAATAEPLAPLAMPALVLDNNTSLDLGTRPHAPMALTFGALFCDSYIANSRPEIGAACAAHVREAERLHQRHPELAWITVAYPVWTATEDIADYRKRLGATLPIGIDRGNAWFRKFGVRNPFTTILLDAAGTEIGRVDGDGAGLAALIDKAGK